MAQRIVITCDLCDSTQDTSEVVISRQGHKSFTVDLCGQRYAKLCGPPAGSRPGSRWCPYRPSRGTRTR